MFDIRLSEEQREFRDLARKFAQEEIKPKAMANASRVLSGSPEISPRPSSSKGVIGLILATPWIHPCSRASGT